MKGLLAFSVFLPALFFGCNALAQRSSSFAVVVSPALFVPVSVAVQGGVQLKAGKKWQILTEAAFPAFYPKNTEYEEIKYWRTGLEVKYFIKGKSSSIRYFSLQNNYLFRELKDADQSFYYTRTQTFSYTNAVIQSPVLSSAFKMGVELPAGKRTFVDAFIGAGLRFIFTEYQAKTVLLTSTEPPKQNVLKFDDAWKNNYTLMRLHATAGMRFGYRL